LRNDFRGEFYKHLENKSIPQKALKRFNKTRGVSHYGLAIYIKKYLKAKEEL